MERSRFSMNDFLLVAILASALYLFISVGVSKIAARQMRVYNEAYELEDTGLFVRYLTLDESGLYDGDKSYSELLVEGTFGYDWGAAIQDNWLYCNEYKNTTMGFMTCDLVRIDLTTYKKEVLLKDTMLRGRCKSGELVCFEGMLTANWFIDTNPLAKFYSLPINKPGYKGKTAIVRLIDPQSGETLYRKPDDAALTDEGEARYLQSDAKEIIG